MTFGEVTAAWETKHPWSSHGYYIKILPHTPSGLIVILSKFDGKSSKVSYL